MTRKLALSIACCTLLATPLAISQPAPPAASAPPPQHSDRDMGRQPMRGGPSGGMGGGMGIVPPGTWWKNSATITALSLTDAQQKKLDDLFLQSRIGLIHLHASLEEEQLKLEPLLNSNPPDQGKTYAQIAKIADLRADLEKTDAKMLLSLRGVLTAEQWTKLQAEQRTRHDRSADAGDRRGGPGSSGGRQQGGPAGQRGPDGHGRPQIQGPATGTATPPPPPGGPYAE